MGTDIHAAIEYRDEAGWHAYVPAGEWCEGGRDWFGEERAPTVRVPIDS
jgi:hypothetical protein